VTLSSIRKKRYQEDDFVAEDGMVSNYNSTLELVRSVFSTWFKAE